MSDGWPADTWLHLDKNWQVQLAPAGPDVLIRHAEHPGYFRFMAREKDFSVVAWPDQVPGQFTPGVKAMTVEYDELKAQQQVDYDAAIQIARETGQLPPEPAAPEKVYLVVEINRDDRFAVQGMVGVIDSAMDLANRPGLTFHSAIGRDRADKIKDILE